MKRIAWVSHYIRESDILSFNSICSRYVVINKILKSIKNLSHKPYVFSTFVNYDKSIECFGIICPVLPAVLVSMRKGDRLGMIKKAMELCNKLNIDQIGIAALFASIWEDTQELTGFTNIPITTGKNLIGSLVIECVAVAHDRLQRKMSEENLGIIGYKGKLAKELVNYYANKFKKILIFENDDKKDNHGNVCNVDIDNLFSNSDTIISSAMGLGISSYIKLLKPGSIVCDTMAPFYLASEIYKKRDDVLAFEGVWSVYSELKYYKNLKGKIQSMLPNEIVPACVAEPIILALENKTCYFSSSANISLDNIGTISQWRNRNGFIFPGFKKGYNTYSNVELERIKNASQR